MKVCIAGGGRVGRYLAQSLLANRHEIVIIEPTGSETLVTLRVGSQDLIGVFRERIAAGPGERIGIAFDNTKMHLFDAQTGNRIAR